NLLAQGGTPQLRYSLDWNRGLASYLAPLSGNNAAASNITSLLDGLLSAQYPNPLQRVQAVQALLGEAGLPPGLATAGNFYTSSTVLSNSVVGTALLLHARDSFALSVYRNRTEDLFLPGQEVLRLIQSTSNDNVQTGAAFNYGHRLTPLDTLNLTLQRENDSGFGINQGLSARQTSFILQLAPRFSPRTVGRVGARRRFLVSTVVGDTPETGVFVGLVHRF
ncbi:MAG: TIGR03016 family PEP-CTERM system-associated outer membrane protein, partial [Betaproteobacteria bacterium]|nr:TIGR03016 family PEP-CTERM system-associated outer membrane protein [Betaproteobacteria bacterium]